MTSVFLEALMHNKDLEANADVIIAHWYEDCNKPVFNLSFYVKAFEMIFLKAQGRYLPDSYFNKLIEAIGCHPSARFGSLLADMHTVLKRNGLKAEFNKVIGLEQRLRNEREGMPNVSRKFTDDEIEDALFETGGNLRLAAEQLNAHHTTLYYRIRKSEHLADVLYEARASEVSE